MSQGGLRELLFSSCFLMCRSRLMPWGNGTTCRVVLMSWKMKEIHITTQRGTEQVLHLIGGLCSGKEAAGPCPWDPPFSSARGKATLFKSGCPAHFTSVTGNLAGGRRKRKKKQQNKTTTNNRKTQSDEMKWLFGQNRCILSDPGFLYVCWESQADNKAQPWHLSPNKLECL